MQFPIKNYNKIIIRMIKQKKLFTSGTIMLCLDGGLKTIHKKIDTFVSDTGYNQECW